MDPKDAPRRANQRDRSRTNSPRDTKRARQSSPPAKPVFGRLQVTADTDGISQVTSHRPGQAVVDLIADDVFALHGPREQAHEILDKIMKHSNGSIFTAVSRFEQGAQASRDDKNTGHAPATDGLFESRRNDHEVAKQEATMSFTSNGQAQRPTTDGQEDDMPSPESSKTMALVSSSQLYSQSPLSNVQSPASPKHPGHRRKNPHSKNRQGFKKASDPDSHLRFKDLDFDSRDFEYLKRDQDCANVACGSCSGKGHHFLACVWPDARGDLVGCPFCNTKEHVMDNCPQQPTLNDFEWTHILVFRRANKPLLRTTRSWYHYAELANRYAAAFHGTMDAHEWNYLLPKGFP
ncbi:hypothetical protein CSAL01_05758 [Colletotrichum salicis]|uniref:Uncharacterized protein n=1 Tax=Colletotrichum salicis TaxID=1209931 RepID=A0A135UJ54_9PEZI|nr:hypothetical protein CSAL01_05758 [Colletotrichum salicis]